MLNTPPIVGELIDENRKAVPAFADWLKQSWRLLVDLQMHGTTAERPLTGLYVAKPYWDDTLGYRINYNGTVWVRWDGTPV